MKIVYISPHLGEGALGGPGIRARNSLGALRAQHNVVELRVSQSNFEIPRVGFRSRQFSDLTKFIQLLIDHTDKNSLEKISSEVSAHNPDVIWISFASESTPIAKHLKRRFPCKFLVADTDTVHWLFLLRLSRHQKLLRRIAYLILVARRFLQEKWLLKHSSIVTAVSQHDLSVFRKMDKGARLEIFSNVIDLNEESKKVFETKMDVLLTGSFGGPESAMTHGTKWFLDLVWPSVRRSNPNVQLAIVGRRASEAFRDDDSMGVHVFSDVDSTSPFFSNAKVSVCPLFFESGTRLKILEAAQHGTPTVSTSLGAEGLSFLHPEEILIADEPIEFANLVNELLRNGPLRMKLGESSRAVVKRSYSIEAACNQVGQILASASENQGDCGK